MGAEQSRRHSQSVTLRGSGSQKNKLHPSWRSASMKYEVNRNGEFGKQHQNSHKNNSKRHSFSNLATLQKQKEVCYDNPRSDETLSVDSEFEIVEKLHNSHEETSNMTKHVEEFIASKTTKDNKEMDKSRLTVEGPKLTHSRSFNDENQINSRQCVVNVIPSQDNDEITNNKKKSTLKRAKSLSDAAQLKKSRAEFVNRSKQFTLMLKQLKQRDSFRELDSEKRKSFEGGKSNGDKPVHSPLKKKESYMDDWIRSQQDRITSLVLAAQRNSASFDEDNNLLNANPTRGDEQTVNINVTDAATLTKAQTTNAKKTPIQKAEEFLTNGKYLGSSSLRQFTLEGMSPVEALKEQYKLKRKARSVETADENARHNTSKSSIPARITHLSTDTSSKSTALRRSHTYHPGGSRIAVTNLDEVMGDGTYKPVNDDNKSQRSTLPAAKPRSPQLLRAIAIDYNDGAIERPKSLEFSSLSNSVCSSRGNSPEEVHSRNGSQMSLLSEHDLRVRNINDSLAMVLNDLRTIREQDVRLARQLIGIGKSIKKFKSENEEEILYDTDMEHCNDILNSSGESSNNKQNDDDYYVTKIEFDGRKLDYVSEESLDSISDRNSVTFSSHW